MDSDTNKLNKQLIKLFGSFWVRLYESVHLCILVTMNNNNFGIFELGWIQLHYKIEINYVSWVCARSQLRVLSVQWEKKKGNTVFWIGDAIFKFKGGNDPNSKSGRVRKSAQYTTAMALNGLRVRGFITVITVVKFIFTTVLIRFNRSSNACKIWIRVFVAINVVCEHTIGDDSSVSHVYKIKCMNIFQRR